MYTVVQNSSPIIIIHHSIKLFLSSVPTHKIEINIPFKVVKLYRALEKANLYTFNGNNTT